MQHSEEAGLKQGPNGKLLPVPSLALTQELTAGSDIHLGGKGCF